MTQFERLHATGILRLGSARSGFRYRRATGGAVRSEDLQRIRNLRLPPAWREVAINSSAHGRLQAVGRDAAGRWQYIYHANHVRQRERKKQERLVRFGEALPRLRQAVTRDLRSKELTRDKALATIMRILASAFIRPGSESYATENGTYGIATLRKKHVTVKGNDVCFDFTGKAGKRHQRSIHDGQVARVVRQMLALPGYEVFKYVDADGKVVDIRRADITDYIKRNMGSAFTAKDFRTWSGTLICACALARAGLVGADSKTARRKKVVAAIKETAEHLGNTPAICRSSYVSPQVLTSYERGKVIDAYFDTVEDLIARRLKRWHRSEHALLALLQHTVR